MIRTALTATAAWLALAAGPARPLEAAPPDGAAPRVPAAVARAFDVVEARRARLALPASPDRPVVTAVPVEDEWFTLVLEPSTVRSAAYRVLVQLPNGALAPVPAGPDRSYRGSLLERPGSVVTATLAEDGLHARIVDGIDEYWVQPTASRVAAAAGPGEHVVFHAADVIPGEGVCAALAPEGLAFAVDGEDGPQTQTAGAPTLCVTQIAIDADSDFLAAYGSVGAVEDRVNEVINAVNLQYERDVGITHAITTIIVRTAGSDPYDTTDPGALLGQFRTQWEDNHGAVPRDVAHLFTGKNLDGSVVGVAYVSVICSSAAYGLSQVDCCGSLACAADLVAHELGHNWSASHCTCAGYTMNPSLTCGGQFEPTTTVPGITSYRDGRTCLDCSAVEPSSCGAVGAGDCLVANGTPHCDDAGCCAAVCAVDATCCDVAWDQACADLAAELCVEPAGPRAVAPSTVQIARGTLLGGTLADLLASDNDRVRVRSEAAGGRERTDYRITCSGAPATASRLDLTVEVGGNLEGVVAFVYLRNFATNAWDRLERLGLPTSDEVHQYLDVPSPGDYVNANGKVKVRVMTKIASGPHVSRLDLVEVMVTP